ncbi:MAG: phosphatidate cytidylyltransferase [Clostridia bacterium]|nr:phosphatidate cytidylyltransferase [Clostridia bacterium]
MRILTAVIGIPLVLALVYWGSWPFLLFVEAIMLAGAYELTAMRKDSSFSRWPLILGLAALAPAAWWGGIGGLAAVAGLTFILMLILVIVKYPQYQLAGGMTAWVSFFYLSLFSTAYLIRALDAEQTWFSWLLFLLITTWVCDSAAYFVGRALGKRKLLPEVSPGKTWAGALGGLLGCLLVALVFTMCLGWNKVGVYFSLACLVGIFGPLGDLGESVIKRTAGVKDSGNLIPGHGGVLDRFDALFVVFPLAYGLLKLWGY